MIETDLVKHGREFERYLRNRQYEQTDEGLVFPLAGAVAFGEYEDQYGVETNLITAEGLNHILDVALFDGLKKGSFYLALYSNNYTPSSTLTAGQFAATAGEIVSASEGYAETQRPQWVPGAPFSGAIDNYNNKAEFNIVTNSEITIRGAALLSDFGKGSTGGVLVSASRFSHERTEYNGNVYQLGYRLRLQSS